MTGDESVIDALNEALKYERTLEACFLQHQLYFKRWGYDGLAQDYRHYKKQACKLRKGTMERINELGAIPGDELYNVEVAAIDTADDIGKVHSYFETLLTEAATAYEQARDVAKEADDSVSHKIMGRHKEVTDELLTRIEGKAKRVKVVGAVAYLSAHMHRDPGKYKRRK